jgi:peptidoglycan hydrolase-like protein with peptidoglycan-binding domain
MNGGIKFGETGVDVAQLQAALTSAGQTIDANEASSQSFGPSTLAALHAFQQQRKLVVGDVVDDATVTALAAVVNQPRGTVTGTLVDGDGDPMSGSKVSLFAEALRVETHLGDATTDTKGAYSVNYVRRSALNLLARAYDPKVPLSQHRRSRSQPRRRLRSI